MSQTSTLPAHQPRIDQAVAGTDRAVRQVAERESVAVAPRVDGCRRDSTDPGDRLGADDQVLPELLRPVLARAQADASSQNLAAWPALEPDELDPAPGR